MSRDAAPAEDARALLVMLAEAAVTGASLARFDDAETLRLALATLMPEMTDHLPAYAMAALSHDAVDIADRAIMPAERAHGRGSMAECVRAVIHLLRDDPRGMPLLTKLAGSAADMQTRQAAARFVQMAGQGAAGEAGA